MGAGFAIRAKGSKAAEILLYEDVGEGWFGGISAKRFADELKGLGKVDTIDLRINSYGGDVFDGLAIYQQLVQHPAKITSHVDGIAASIASIIAMAGDEIRIAEAGWFMIHDAWGMAVGNAAEMRRQAELLESVTNQLAGVYEARTKQPLETLRAWMADETWLDAAAAVERGFANSVAENLRMAAHAAPPKRFRNIPSALADDPEERALRERVSAQCASMQRRRDLQQHRTRGAG